MSGLVELNLPGFHFQGIDHRIADNTTILARVARPPMHDDWHLRPYKPTIYTAEDDARIKEEGRNLVACPQMTLLPLVCIAIWAGANIALILSTGRALSTARGLFALPQDAANCIARLLLPDAFR